MCLSSISRAENIRIYIFLDEIENIFVVTVVGLNRFMPFPLELIALTYKLSHKKAIEISMLTISRK